MRRATLIFLSLLLAIVLDTTFVPVFLPGSAKPNLTLVVVSVWAGMGVTYGYVWAFLAGLALDALSVAPTGMFTLSLLGGNLVARVIEAAPIQVEWFRITVWVALVTVVAHSAWIVFHRLTGQIIDVTYAAQFIILPALILNPLLSIPVFLVQNRLWGAFRDQGLNARG